MCDAIDVQLGRRLRRRRKLLGLTQQELALTCDLRMQQIHKYESGLNRMSATILWRLACALEVDVNYFFAGLAAGGSVYDAGSTSSVGPQAPGLY